MDAADQISIPDPKVMSAESLFERRWALTLLESVMRRMTDENVSAGRLAQYEQLKALPHGGTRQHRLRNTGCRAAHGACLGAECSASVAETLP